MKFGTFGNFLFAWLGRVETADLAAYRMQGKTTDFDIWKAGKKVWEHVCQGSDVYRQPDGSKRKLLIQTWDDEPPIPFDDWSCYGEALARIEVNGNDGGDIAEFEELCGALEANLAGIGMTLKEGIEAMETWVQRQMGPAFDPEKTCQYTGLPLWTFPDFSNTGGCLPVIQYWREDKRLMRVRVMTPEECAWSAANQERIGKEREKLVAWVTFEK